ncbi:hypothetical protein BG015_004702 [Linnemannia schmuckeri]|uniref:N-acetyltransferase domain-containing protein n=1 Tax=Linnemannia schmuckeri TaxID=64567 RepID=A0A9P5UZ63_9FUNG|nr:hypothetical protein BG015_004702 [Linnemannia schmuckeri]
MVNTVTAANPPPTSETQQPDLPAVIDSSEKPVSVVAKTAPLPDLDYVVPNREEHQKLLVAMRKACGWDAGMVPTWFIQQAEGTRFMAIFYLPGTTTPIGMGGVELQDFDQADKDVADMDSKRGCIVSLFLYKQYRGKGYLGKILSICEDIAREKGLRVLTIYGLAKAGGYEKFGYRTFKMAMRNYGGENNWETRYLEKIL